MKSFYKKNRKLIIIILILIVLILALWRILDNYKGFSFKSSKSKDAESSLLEKVDVAGEEYYLKFEDKVEAFFEGKWVLNLSFLYPKDMKVERGEGKQQNWFKAFDVERNNFVTLYFTYEGGRGYSIDDYIKEVLGVGSTTLKVQELKFSDEDSSVMKYVLDENANTEYYLKPVKNEEGETWLAIVENVKADDEVSKSLAKDIFRSLETK
ncbi:MAG: hypothetical protein RI945_64 [Candidatus Parcubacteria bacterium]|jgi:hypothetical protein